MEDTARASLPLFTFPLWGSGGVVETKKMCQGNFQSAGAMQPLKGAGWQGPSHCH